MEDVNDYDVIVLGVGAAGSAAAYHLAKRGASVLGLEQFGVPNSKGSSRGFTRVINPAIREKPQYVRLIRRSIELWNELQEMHPNRLISRTGALRGWAPPNYVGHRDSFDESVELSESQSLPHEVLDGAEVEARYPGYSVSPEFKFLYQPDGGLLDPQECIIAHMNAAHSHGAEIRAHERVDTWESTGNGVRVRTNKGEYDADHLLVTAGPWLSDVADRLRNVVSRRAVMGWFRPKTPEKFTQETFPAFGWDTEEGYFYGTPAHRIDGVKVGGTVDLDSDTTVDPNAIDRTPTAADEAMLRRFMEKHLPGAAGSVLRMSVCMTTSAPDKQYVIDTYPDDANVHVAGGFSGSGFMTSSAVGELASELILDGSANVDLEPFRILRL